MFQLISVIIPIYNNQKYLKKCLDSILNQTYKNLEIICIDDCSSDSSYEILQAYKKRDSRLKIIKNNENLGSGKTRNLGLELARGEYVFFIDSDDYIELNTLEILINKALEINADFVGYNLVRVDEKTLNKTFCKAENFIDKYFQSISASTKLYNMDFLLRNKIKFDTIRTAEDMIVAFKIFASAEKYDWLDFNGYYYLQREGSLTKKKTKEKDDLILKDIFIALNHIKSFLKTIDSNDKTNFLRRKFKETEQNYIFYHYNTRHDLNKNDFIVNCKLYFGEDIDSFNKINSRIIMHTKKEKEFSELSSELFNQIDNYKNEKLIIYGLNDLGKIIFQNYKNRVVSIIDQNKFGSYYENIMITTLDEIKSIENIIFVITAINNDFIDEIQNNINLKFTKAKIIKLPPNLKKHFDIHEFTNNILLTPKSQNRLNYFLVREEIQISIFLEFIKQFKPDIVFDIGANVGFYTLISNKYFPDKKYFCFEASPDTFKELNQNINFLTINNNINLFAIALSSENAEKDFYEFGNCSGKNSLAKTSIHLKEKNHVNILKIKSKTLDSLITSLNKVYILKIDTEGHEYDILLGGKKMLLQNNCIIQLELEYCDKNKIINFLESINYKHIMHIGPDSYFSNIDVLKKESIQKSILEKATSKLVYTKWGKVYE